MQKLWFSRKVAFGVSFKDKGQNSFTQAAAYSKVIGTFELQASKSIRIGLSYDGNPYSDYAITGGNVNTGSLFQLFFRYESTSERESTNRLKYF